MEYQDITKERLDMIQRTINDTQMADRIQMDLHSGGHEIRYESGLAFLKKWLSF